MRKFTRQILKYILATICVVSLACFAGIKLLDKNLDSGKADQPKIVSINKTTTQYVIIGGKAYLSKQYSNDKSLSAQTENSGVKNADAMESSDEDVLGISIYNSDLEFVFLKDGVTNLSHSTFASQTDLLATELTDDIASIVTATRTSSSVELAIEDQQQTAVISTSLDAVYSLNALALSVNSSLEYNNGNFMVASQQASVSLLADSSTTSAFAQKSALVMKLDAGNVVFKGKNSTTDPVVYYSPDQTTLGMGRAFYLTGGNLTIDKNVVLDGFSATNTSLTGGTSGGAIYVSNSTSTLTLNCTIKNCQASSFGGAIYSNGTITVNGGEYINNESTNNVGGFIYSYRNNNNSGCGVVNVNGGTISNNSSDGDGGAIYNTYIVNLNGGTIANNTSNSGMGGGVNGATININGATITGNYGDSAGGGVYGSTVNFTSGSISNNSTDSEGGGIYATNCTVGKNAVIDGNRATELGGGIYATTLKFTGAATISNNDTWGYGGGIYIPSGGSYTSSGETISNNHAGESGGGLYYASTTALTLSGVISGNESLADGGGGVSAYSASSITLNNAQIYGNQSSVEGGGIDCSCTITYTGGNASMGVYNNTCYGQGQDIYFGDSSNYIQLNLGVNYGTSAKTCSVYKNGLTTIATSSSNANMILKASANSYASKFREYLVVENFNMSGESTYQCRMNLIEWDDTTSTTLYAEKDICLLAFKPGNEWTDYMSGYNIYYDDNIYACFTDRAKEFNGSSAVVTTSGRSWQFSNNFTVNFWASMSYWNLYTSEKVMASSGVSSNNKGWKFVYGTNGAISCAIYDSGTSAYKYINLQTKYSNLTNGKSYMFTLTVSSSNYAILYLSQGGEIVDHASVQLSGSVGYYYVVGQNTSSTVLGGLSSGTGSIASGHYWDGKMQMFEIVRETWTSDIIEQISNEGTSQGAGVYKMGIGGQTYTLSVPSHPDSKSFYGWMKEQEFSGSLNENTFTFGSNSDTYLSRLVGTWTKGSYTIVFDKNASDATGTMSNQTVAFDAQVQLRDNGFTRYGYTFVGWSKDKNAGLSTYKNKANVTNITSSSQVYLYAVWSPNKICIKLDTAGSSTSLVEEFYYLFDRSSLGFWLDSDMTEDPISGDKLTPPTKAGYTFTGYVDTTTGSRYIDSQGKISSSLFKEVGEDTTLYAVYQAKVISVTLNHQGGSSSVDSICFKYGTNTYYKDPGLKITCSSVSIPTLAGYTFKGYYANPASYTSSSAVMYIDESGTIQSRLCTITTSTSISIYANWKLNTYKVTFVIVAPDNIANACYFSKNGSSVTNIRTVEINNVPYNTSISSLNTGSDNRVTVGDNWVAPKINSSITTNGYTATFTRWTNADGKIKSNRTVTAYFEATPILYTLKFKNLTKSNTTLYDGRDSSLEGSELTLLENAGSTNSNRWYYELKYTIEDEIYFPWATRKYYTVRGWENVNGNGVWQGNYDCGEYVDNAYGNGEFVLDCSANIYQVQFVCDPADKDRESLITNTFPALKKTIYIPYNGALGEDAYYYEGQTKVFLGWTDMPTVNGLSGWYKKASIGGSAVRVVTQLNDTFDFETKPNGSIVFKIYAVWKSITIVYHGKTPIGEGAQSNIVTSYGETITLANPISNATRGYTFNGWFTRQNGQGTLIGDEDESYTVDYYQSSVLHLYAYWTGNEYTITWNAVRNNSTERLFNASYWNYAGGNYTSTNNGNSNRLTNYVANGYTAISKVTYGSTGLGYVAPIPMRVGYSFLHWIDSYGNMILQTDLKNFEADTEDDEIPYLNENAQWNYAGNIDLYAVWNAKSYDISVDTKGGTISGTVPATYSVTNGAIINAPVKEFYTFSGWDVVATLNRYTQATINIDNGYLEYNSSYANAVFYEPFYMASGISYTANKRSATSAGAEIRWRAFNTNGQYYANLGTSTTYTGQGKYAMLWYNNGNVNSTENIYYSVGAQDFSTSTFNAIGDLSLTAKWTVNKYNISYDFSSGEAGEDTPQSVNCNTLFSVSNPKREGYVFGGWNISNMDASLHQYGTPASLTSTNATSLSRLVGVTTFKNLRSDNGGTVNFKAIWLVENISITVTSSAGSVGYYLAGNNYYSATSHTLYGRPGSNKLIAKGYGATLEPRYYEEGGYYYGPDKKTVTYASEIYLSGKRDGYVYGGLQSSDGRLVVDTSCVVQAGVKMSDTTLTDDDGNWNSWTNKTASASIGLTVKWEEIEYRVIFDNITLYGDSPSVDGFDLSISDRYGYFYSSSYINYNLTFTVKNPEHDGYTFAGWKITSQNGSVIKSKTTETSFERLTLTNNDIITFKAIWKTELIGLTISDTSNLGLNYTNNLYTRYNGAIYHINDPGGTIWCVIDENSEITYEKVVYEAPTVYGSNNIIEVTVDPSKQGYSFTGLYNKADNQKLFNKDLGRTTGANNVIKDADSLTVYPKWDAIQYKVSFKNLNGTDAVDKSYYKHYDEIFRVDYPTRDGYDFNGWKITGMDNCEHYYGINSLVLTTTESTIELTSCKTFKNLRSTSGMVTFTAQWTEKNIKVTFDPNGGNFYDSDGENIEFEYQMKSYKSQYGKEMPTPTRVAYEFVGWFTTSTGGTQVKSDTTVTNANDHTLYAHWKAIEYKIEYSLLKDCDHAENLELILTHNNETTVYGKDATSGTITFVYGDKIEIKATNITAQSNGISYGFQVHISNDNYPSESVAAIINENDGKRTIGTTFYESFIKYLSVKEYTVLKVRTFKELSPNNYQYATSYKIAKTCEIYIDPTYTHLYNLYLRVDGSIVAGSSFAISRTSSIEVVGENVQTAYQGDSYGFEITKPDGSKSTHTSSNYSGRSSVTTTISAEDLWSDSGNLIIKSCRVSSTGTTYGTGKVEYNSITYKVYRPSGSKLWVTQSNESTGIDKRYDTKIQVLVGSSSNAQSMGSLLAGGKLERTIALVQNTNIYIYAEYIWLDRNSVASGFVAKFKNSYYSPIDFSSNIENFGADNSHYYRIKNNMIVKPFNGYSSGMSIDVYPGIGATSSEYWSWNYWDGTKTASIEGSDWTTSNSKIGDSSNAVLMVVNSKDDKKKLGDTLGERKKEV